LVKLGDVVGAKRSGAGAVQFALDVYTMIANGCKRIF